MEVIVQLENGEKRIENLVEFSEGALEDLCERVSSNTGHCVETIDLSTSELKLF
ncbi:hypothetical protein ACPV5O_20910 [Vibrio maritimus]|jgi:hypothetical protein|uniref:hypothetical protein n=1 Tax=Vibrio maritimus TaxID=990268 RepID=UPI004068BD1B